MELTDGKRIKEADRAAVHDRGIPSLRLMEAAADALADLR